MFQCIIFLFGLISVHGYFTSPGKCPENIKLKEDFRLADFYGKWFQAYHYASDGQNRNNCSTIELIYKPSGVYLNQSRVDRGLFHRYSIGSVEIPIDIEDSANLNVTFTYENGPRRLKIRRYPFRVLATNYNYYATVHTCQYSPLIDKHFVYVWVLSRQPILNDVSKELAVKPLSQLGVDPHKLVKDDLSTCAPKYYEDKAVEANTFNFSAPI